MYLIADIVPEAAERCPVGLLADTHGGLHDSRGRLGGGRRRGLRARRRLHAPARPRLRLHPHPGALLRLRRGLQRVHHQGCGCRHPHHGAERLHVSRLYCLQHSIAQCQGDYDEDDVSWKLCNNIILQGDISSAFTLPALDSIRQPLVLLLIINNSVLGIVTSLFLKKLNSILKAFASALELVVTAVLSVPVLGIPLNLHTVLALGLISVAVVMYARNPVTSQTEHQDKSRSDDAGNKV